MVVVSTGGLLVLMLFYIVLTFIVFTIAIRIYYWNKERKNPKLLVLRPMLKSMGISILLTSTICILFLLYTQLFLER